MNSTAVPRRPLGGTLFTWTMSIVSGLFVGGSYLDGWAHTHGRVDETFFTPWHAVLYSAYLLVASILGITAVRNFLRRLRRDPFRVFVHRSEDVDAIARASGLVLRSHGQTMAWRVGVYVRRETMEAV